MFKLNTAALEGSMKAEVLRPVEVVARYVVDGRRRIDARILTGPERGRVVQALCPGSLRDRRGKFLAA